MAMKRKEMEHTYQRFDHFVVTEMPFEDSHRRRVLKKRKREKRETSSTKDIAKTSKA